ncbi:unnamed protein product [Rangifer tarandus platyrhynchus]|uniref:Uncharacterized protein n=2 Tax=Rangifer tarandus platyrhynchus TaxID=3082113 RepID=A0ABN8YAK0_RANTA|nr:unnamed protein product [Rangifer tarandus platyrhynchus]
MVKKKCFLQCRRPRFNPWVGKILWRRKWQPTLVFLPGEFYEQRSLAGYSPWGGKELDTTEPLTLQGFLLVQAIKNLYKVQATWDQSLGMEDPLEKGNATHSSILVQRIPRMEEPSGLQFLGSQRVGPN